MENNIYKTSASLSTSVLKSIAYITMIIDHCGALVMPEILGKFGINAQDSLLIYTMRFIGRISFPLFAFLIAQGMCYTSNRKKYIFKLFIFAVISEIPFDLARTGTVWDKSYQNVLFSLFLSAVLILLWDLIENRIKKHNLEMILKVVILLAVLTATTLLLADYRICAPLLVLCFYKLKKNPWSMFPVAVAVLLVGNAIDYSIPYFYPMNNIDAFSMQSIIALLQAEMPSVLALPLIYSNNGQKGRQLPKLFYYMIYPAHLLIIYIIVLLIR